MKRLLVPFLLMSTMAHATPQTDLKLAIQHNDSELAISAIKSGANILKKDQNGVSPLAVAMTQKSQDFVLLLTTAHNEIISSKKGGRKLDLNISIKESPLIQQEIDKAIGSFGKQTTNNENSIAELKNSFEHSSTELTQLKKSIGEVLHGIAKELDAIHSTIKKNEDEIKSIQLSQNNVTDNTRVNIANSYNEQLEKIKVINHRVAKLEMLVSDEYQPTIQSAKNLLSQPIMVINQSTSK
ncbi:hypothetical protein [Photobacterium leiognathi]|uniref:hypothetical protein n=1 Tax=Photobacterium leiognathi TaxID=553611 RepID=UPI0029828288|nr:hypothetical protein [Photobacterium leiognathi]